MGRRWRWILIAGTLLVLVSACIRRNIEQTLTHPAISLIRADPSLTFQDIAWSPDGDLLAATGMDVCVGGRCPYRIYVLDLRTYELRPLLDDYGQSDPAWTFDPRAIGFTWVSDESPSSGIYVIRLDDDQPQFVAHGHMASWSSDGRYVAIVRGRGPTTSSGYLRPSVSVLDLTTDLETKVFETPQKAEEIITGLAWSPNNEMLVLSANWYDGTNYVGKVFVVNANGTNLRVVVDGAEPGWTPDGKWLYYTDSNGRLIFTPLDGRCVVAPLNVTHIRSPAISPTGDQIVFEHEGNIYLLNLDYILGSDRKELACPEN